MQLLSINANLVQTEKRMQEAVKIVQHWTDVARVNLTPERRRRLGHRSTMQIIALFTTSFDISK